MRIAFVGLPRTGKDTAGSYLAKKYFFQRLAFGDAMKFYYYKANPEMRDKPKDREHMIAWSQPQVEKDNLIWIRPLEDELNSIAWQGQEDFVITDLRQPHEEQWARQNGFLIVRVVSDSKVTEQRASALGEKVGQDLDLSRIQHDYVISNNGKLADLWSQIDCLVYHIK
ncbi:TPA: AAA family ATPase [Bacillus pacificus]